MNGTWSLQTGTYRMSEGAYSTLDSTIVEIVSDTGMSGWEDVPGGPDLSTRTCPGARAALDQMSPGLIGKEVTGPLTIRRSMDKLLNGHNYAKAAIDIAIHDLIGKTYGIRVSDMLGGAISDSVNSYYALALGNPDEAARTAAEKVAEGYPRLQIKVGGRPVELDIETIRKVWEATACTRLAVDANLGLTTRDVLRIDRECADIPFIFEQPCNTMEEIAAIRAQVHHPIYLDEHREPQHRAPCDLTRHCRRLRAQGHAPGRTRQLRDSKGRLRVAIHAPHMRRQLGGDIIAAACVQIAATMQPRLLEGVWIANSYMDVHYDSNNPVRIEGGHIKAAHWPGSRDSSRRGRLR